MGKRGKKESPVARMMKFMDLPDFAMGQEECIEIWGGNTVLVQGAKGIHTYESEIVKIHIKNGLLILVGSDLSLARFSDGAIQIKGQPKQISWERENDG